MTRVKAHQLIIHGAQNIQTIARHLRLKPEIQTVPLSQMKLVRPAKPEELKRIRRSPTMESQTWQQTARYLVALLQDENIGPYEQGLVIDFDAPEVKQDLAGLTNPRQTFIQKLRTLIKELGLNNKIELHQYGMTLAIVGKS